MNDPLYLIAILPPAAIQIEIVQFQKKAASLFEAAHALKSPPHITLAPPLRWSDAHLEKLTDALINFTILQSPFELMLKNFGCFAPSVIFVAVEPKKELTDLRQALDRTLSEVLLLDHQSSYTFHPHISVAFRDLKPEQFSSARAYFSRFRYERTFEVETLTILKYLDRRWQVFMEFRFGQQP